ncbi:MAG TPA: hypothetical protein VN610_05060 [Bryobacteraceae bacterium]|nr:hypothetical protein [Bryobacteraceae bacterium]
MTRGILFSNQAWTHTHTALACEADAAQRAVTAAFSDPVPAQGGSMHPNPVLANETDMAQPSVTAVLRNPVLLPAGSKHLHTGSVRKADAAQRSATAVFRNQNPPQAKSTRPLTALPGAARPIDTGLGEF